MNRTRILTAVAAATAFFGGSQRGRAQGTDDRAAATALVQQLEQDAAHAAATAPAVAHAREALERGIRLRAAHDEPHARAADGVAREWAEGGRDLSRALDQEAQAADSKRKAVDAQAGVERERALVEAAIARVGRLTAELEEATRTTLGRPAAEAREGDGGGARKGPPDPAERRSSQGPKTATPPQKTTKPAPAGDRP